jgi:hypothetical protein
MAGFQFEYKLDVVMRILTACQKQCKVNKMENETHQK